MKKLLYVFTFVLLGSLSAFSQSRVKGKPFPQRDSKETLWIQKNLNLSTKQVAELKKLRADKFKVEQEIYKSNKKQLDKNKKLRQAYLKTHRQKLERILNERQLAALKKYRTELRSKQFRNLDPKQYKDQKDFSRAERSRSSRTSR